MSLIIPGWAQDGGREAMLTRFADPVQRARIVTEAEAAMNARFGGAAGIYLTATKQELTAVMASMNVQAGEAVVRLLEQSSPGIIARFGVEADLVAILKHPTSSVACDCGAVAGEASHPRYFGTFPRVLGRYVREQQIMSWEEAIRKMTGLPAATIGMVDRGWLAPGMAADIVVFDPATIIDHATFEAPTLPSEGVHTVILNGQIALDGGAVTGTKAGRALRRGPHMPTRPMTPPGARTLRHRLSSMDVQMTLDVTQAAGARAASGTVRFTQAGSGVALEMTAFGQIQTTAGWASLTGRGRLRPGNPEESVTIVLDGDTVDVQVGDFHYATGTPIASSRGPAESGPFRGPVSPMIGSMTRISVQDLKAQLSGAIARAEAGETLVITRHNEPVAQLTPVASTHAAPWAQGRSWRGSGRPSQGGLKGPKGLLLATLLDDRGDR